MIALSFIKLPDPIVKSEVPGPQEAGGISIKKRESRKDQLHSASITGYLGECERGNVACGYDGDWVTWRGLKGGLSSPAAQGPPGGYIRCEEGSKDVSAG